MPTSTTTVSVPIRSPLFLFCNNKKGKYNTWIPQYLSCPVPLKRKKKSQSCLFFFFFLHITPSSHLTLFRYPPCFFFFFFCMLHRSMLRVLFIIIIRFLPLLCGAVFRCIFPLKLSVPSFLFVVFWRFNFFFFFLVLFLRSSVFLSLFFFFLCSSS